MKDIRERIIEILKDPHWFLNGKLFESDFDRIADEIHALYENRIKVQVDINDRLLLELRDRYPKEFIEWCLSSCCYKTPFGKYRNEEPDKIFDSLDELYEYYKNLKK